jgi:putative ABC transport system permease protein
MKALGRRLVAGRTLAPSDDEREQRVAVVNEAFVRKFWPGEDAVGKHVRIDAEDPDITIVGVAADVKYAGIDQPSGTEIVFPVKQADIDTKYAQGQGVPRSVYFLLRTRDDPRAVFAGIRATVADVAPTIPVSRLQTMEDAVQDDIAQPRFLTSLVLGFAAIALVMAAVGVYGVMSYSVMQRSHEIGIRMALGAPPGKVLGMLVRQGLTLAAVGSGLGLAMSFALQRVLARTISGLLFGSSALDPAMLAAVAIPLVGVAMVACYLPAYRASRIRPLIAMRVET